MQRIFQQLIVTLDSHKTQDQSHQSHGIFQSYDSTAAAEQEKKLRKKAAADSVQWLKILWRRNEMQHISIHTFINDPDVRGAYPIKDEDETVKISYSLSVHNGIWLQNYGKVCQEASLDASTPLVVINICNDPITFVAFLSACFVLTFKVVHTHAQDSAHCGLQGRQRTGSHFFLVALLYRAIHCLHVIACNPAHPYFSFVHFEDAIEVSACLGTRAVNLSTQSSVL